MSKCPHWRDGLNSPSCNCGVAVAAGRDIFIMSKCEQSGPWDIGFKNCEDGVLRDKVLERDSSYIVSN